MADEIILKTVPWEYRVFNDPVDGTYVVATRHVDTPLYFRIIAIFYDADRAETYAETENRFQDSAVATVAADDEKVPVEIAAVAPPLRKSKVSEPAAQKEPRQAWAPDDEDLLAKYGKKFGRDLNYQKILHLFPGRTEKALRLRVAKMRKEGRLDAKPRAKPIQRKPHQAGAGPPVPVAPSPLPPPPVDPSAPGPQIEPEAIVGAIQEVAAAADKPVVGDLADIPPAPVARPEPPWAPPASKSEDRVIEVPAVETGNSVFGNSVKVPQTIHDVVAWRRAQSDTVRKGENLGEWILNGKAVSAAELLRRSNSLRRSAGAPEFEVEITEI